VEPGAAGDEGWIAGAEAAPACLKMADMMFPKMLMKYSLWSFTKPTHVLGQNVNNAGQAGTAIEWLRRHPGVTPSRFANRLS
jgi:hypothetical protein